MLSPQWFVKTKPLAKPAIEAVKKGVTKIFPKKRFEKLYFDWMENILDWNISRQIVWGPRIPAWYCLEENEDIQINFINKEKQIISATYKELKEKYPFEEIKDGLQSLSAPTTAKYSLDDNKVCNNCGSKKILQETDTFDTWFLSGQWPLTTLGFPVSPDFKYFYPTSVLDTLWDILFFWVARMMMLGLYRAKKVPFKVVHLHARVVDEKGKKMSKSRGNVINPIEMVEKYSADALRMALVYGVAPASDVVVSEDKIRAMRNFANKVWNMARFLTIIFEKYSKPVPFYSKSLVSKLNKDDKKIISSLEKTITKVNSSLEKYRFSDAAESIYHFMWDELASSYIEKTKNREDKNISLSVLRHCYLTSLKLLHPFMPFVTETIWQEIKNLRDKKESLLITSSWPDVDQ
jgi:valyl-tRNA synthetase